MRVFILMTIILLVIIHHRCAIASNDSALMRKVVSKNDNILEQLYIQMKQQLFHYCPQVIFIGGSSEQLLTAKPLMKNYPYFVGKNLQSIMAEKFQFSTRGLILFFLTSIDDEYVKNISKEVWNCTTINFFFIYEGNATKNEIDAILSTSTEIDRNIPKLVTSRMFVHHDGGVVKFYKKQSSVNCKMETVMISNFSKERNFRKIRIRHYSNDLNNKGCPGTIVTRHFPPRMILGKQPNGKLKITGGYEGNMVMELAKLWNFSPFIVSLDVYDTDQLNNASHSQPQTSSAFIMIVDQIRNSLHMSEYHDFSIMYGRQCAIWCVPRITKWRYIIVAGQFSTGTWALFATIFTLLTAVFGLIRIRYSTERGAISKTSHFCSALFYIYSLSLGNSLSHRSISVNYRIFLLMCLFYSVITNTAYKSSLASILSADNDKSAITDTEGILEANLSIGGDWAGFELLKEQSEENATIRELIKRYVVYNDTLAALRRVSFDKDFALLIPGRDLRYHIDKFHELHDTRLTYGVIDSCVLSYNTAIALPKGSGSTRVLDDALYYFMQSGLAEHWWNERDIKKQVGTVNNPRGKGIGRENFYQILIVCAIPLIASILVFFGELTYYKFQLRGKIVKSLIK